MSPQSLYFDQIFANAGDRTTVPDPTQSNGTVSYEAGFPIGYSTPVAAGGFNFPRNQHNQILNDVTAALQLMQQNGCFSFITSTMNGGSPYPYNLGVIVSYNAGGGTQNWISTTSNNTTVPGAVGANWLPLGTLRIVLTSATTFYVATSGNDSTGNGTSGSPWATIQHAYNIIQTSYDVGDNLITIQVENGTYSAGLIAQGGCVGAGEILILGNATTPDDVIIDVAANNCFSAQGGANISVQGFKLESGGSATSGNGLYAATGGQIYYSNIDFGTCGNAHISVNTPGAFIQKNVAATAIKISGGAIYHASAIGEGQIDESNGNNSTVTLTGTPAFSGAYAIATIGGSILEGNITFSGSATGVYFIAENGGIINTSGGGATYLPGNSAGSGTNFGTSPYGLYL